MILQNKLYRLEAEAGERNQLQPVGRLLTLGRASGACTEATAGGRPVGT
jgi:hypothetical protein